MVIPAPPPSGGWFRGRAPKVEVVNADDHKIPISVPAGDTIPVSVPAGATIPVSGEGGAGDPVIIEGTAAMVPLQVVNPPGAIPGDDPIPLNIAGPTGGSVPVAIASSPSVGIPVAPGDLGGGVPPVWTVKGKETNDAIKVATHGGVYLNSQVINVAGTRLGVNVSGEAGIGDPVIIEGKSGAVPVRIEGSATGIPVPVSMSAPPVARLADSILSGTFTMPADTAWHAVCDVVNLAEPGQGPGSFLSVFMENDGLQNLETFLGLFYDEPNTGTQIAYAQTSSVLSPGTTGTRTFQSPLEAGGGAYYDLHSVAGYLNAMGWKYGRFFAKYSSVPASPGTLNWTFFPSNFSIQLFVGA